MGTASKDGESQISPKGSVMAFDRDTLAYWERVKRSALDNVAENPQVVVYYAHAADDHHGLAKAALRVSRRIGQRDKHLPGLTAILSDVVLDWGVSAVVAVLVPEALEDALGGVPLLPGAL